MKEKATKRDLELIFAGNVRHCSVPRDMGIKGLRSLIATMFPRTMRRLVVRWVDEEKEGIVIQHDRDLKEALNTEATDEEQKHPLKIIISAEGSPSTLPLRLSRTFAELLSTVDAASLAATSPHPRNSNPTGKDGNLRVADAQAENTEDNNRGFRVLEGVKGEVIRGVIAVPVLSLILLPCFFFGLPIAIPYIFVRLVKDRQNLLGRVMGLAVYPFGPIIELLFSLLLLILIPLWIPVGSLLFGTSAGIGLTFLLTASTSGLGVFLLPIMVIASAGLWFGIGMGLSFLLIITLLPVSSLLFPIWMPLCCVAWYTLTPALYFDLVDVSGWDGLVAFLWSQVAKRVTRMTRLCEMEFNLHHA
uniref:PB1 domain-containing protein n=1 Tax=Lotharella oceanica TaxID=641309 RepID=A0A7S2TWY4_9EUKA|mmetsp:Transcript_32/g.70  ORF Transcript_32/g.70 Transcript_32/m.70 type:complete len:360 (+) Transcript_32:73-1152(+)